MRNSKMARKCIAYTKEFNAGFIDVQHHRILYFRKSGGRYYIVNHYHGMAHRLHNVYNDSEHVCTTDDELTALSNYEQMFVKS